MNLSWVPYLVVMLKSKELRGYLRNLFNLTGGDVVESKAAVRRMRDQGIVLRDVQDDVDRRLDAIDAEDAKVVELGGKPPRGSA